MDERQARLVAIIASPEQDAPRLAFADWLEKHGDKHDHARAEFIRVQCRSERLPYDDPEQKELGKRERRLRAAHAQQWLGPLYPYTGPEPLFTRGLLDDWAPFVTE